MKYITSLHGRLAEQLQAVIEGEIPDWMPEGRTTLIMKDKNISSKVVTNYRPITCLSTTWKLLTSILTELIYDHLQNNNLLPWEQKGCKKRSRGTKDNLLIDKLIMNHAKRKHRNLRMVWIDYKKAYDSVPHSWIIKSLELMGVATNIGRFLGKAMGMWKTTLTINNDAIGDVQIRRDIFQGDSLSPILFIMALIPLSIILRNCQDGYRIGGMNVSHSLYMDDLKIYA